VNSILIIDDNQGVCSALEILLSLHDLQAMSANTAEDGLSMLASHQVNLVIQDMNFTEDTTSGADGEQLFARIREDYPQIPIILLTAWTHLDTAVKLVKGGAADYLAKPWDDDKLVTSIRNLLELNRVGIELDARKEDQATQRQALAGFDLCGTVFESSAMMQVIHLAAQVADSDLPVLITGPNGAGKEKIAEIIHANSRRSGPMVAVNAGAMPSDLIESELFGATAGAFTGATNREGRFAKAHKGTLFLDEIGNLSLSGQMKLLRVLQTGQFEKLGSAESQTADVRIICATNDDLPARIRAGQFREDLYYRINVLEISIPPLNNRQADILPLARHFLDQGRELSIAAERALFDYHWPGNVRELQNCMRRAQLLRKSGPIELSDLRLDLEDQRAWAETAGGAGELRGELSRELSGEDIQAALDRFNGVVSRAAKSLGLSRQAFYRRMENFGLKSQSNL
jgi:DNA-binding NtrC family response regulator